MEDAVLERYKKAAKKVEKSLCCPTTYNQELLKVIPTEILEKDYGCGDPSQYIKEGEVVLDLGSGAGKLCYIISQVVGSSGRVIGIDMNDEMLSVARKYKDEIADKLGYSNVEFHKAKIQNLKLDLEKVDEYLKTHSIKSSEDLTLLNAYCETLESKTPLIPDNSIDVVVSNCVLNLVKSDEKKKLFQEIYRVLRDGGRAVISDIVSDEDIPAYMQSDPELWSGCISGAFREDLFLKEFEDAGFYGVEIVKWDNSPWQVVDEIEFRSVTVVAWKGRDGVCIDKGEAVIYKGPYKKIEDDDGHIYERGKRIAVCEKTFNLLSKKPYNEDFIFIKPVGSFNTKAFNLCKDVVYRHPKETKGGVFFSEQKNSYQCCQGYESFAEKLKKTGKRLEKTKITTIQVNLGNLCNQTCQHCHVDASSSGNLMSRDVIEKIITLLRQNQGLAIDITGGAPELHPELTYLIKNISGYASEIYLRTNLTALSGKLELLNFFKDFNVQLVASLPDTSKQKTDFIRGDGVFEKSIEMLKLLNKNGYGTKIPLHIVHNPTGYCLPELQSVVESRYRSRLQEEYGIVFNKLFVINNMPVGRFRKILEKDKKFNEYLTMVASNFNPDTLNNLMCREVINIGYDGRLYDCDFNNALNLERLERLEDFQLNKLLFKEVIVSEHCYVCTALKGSGCYGSVA